MTHLKGLFFNTKAVSPVIGVMLMIVVTVILAAAVSSYANDMGPKDMPPQTNLVAEASLQKGFILLEHLGGDTIEKMNIVIEIESGYPPQSGNIDIQNVTFLGGSNFLNPGDEAKINFTSSADSDYITFSGEEISQSVELGEPFTISVIDVPSGQTIHSSKITLLS